jgi:hypothetical protein
MSLDRRMRAMGWPPLEQVAPDRVVITDDDRYMCKACGELPVADLSTMYCRRCERQMQEDRLERESNR